MSKSSYTDHPVLNDLFDDEPTDPYVAVSAGGSLPDADPVSGFVARGRSLGYRVDPPAVWAEVEPDQIVSITPITDDLFDFGELS